MWKLVIEDFKTAGTLLPFFAAPETGRADRAAAYGMLAKAYLYIASAKEHGVPQYAAMSHDVDEYYAEAVKYAGLVVDNPEQTVFRFDDNLPRYLRRRAADRTRAYLHHVDGPHGRIGGAVFEDLEDVPALCFGGHDLSQAGRFRRDGPDP